LVQGTLWGHADETVEIKAFTPPLGCFRKKGGKKREAVLVVVIGSGASQTWIHETTKGKNEYSM